MVELDGIRGIAIIGVLLSHSMFVLNIVPAEAPGAAEPLLRKLLIPGWGGVDLFFALSGFLITGILLRTKDSPRYFRSFYARRVLRIFPIYYLSLAAMLLAAALVPKFHHSVPAAWSERLSYFLYLQNWPLFWHGRKEMWGVLWGIYWSLAVEEQFYLVWPWFVLKLDTRHLLRICCAGFVLALPLRIALQHCCFGTHLGLYVLTTSHLDSLFAGSACALYMLPGKRLVPIEWIASASAAGASILLWIAIFHPLELTQDLVLMPTIGITAYALLSGSLIALSQRGLRALNAILTMRWLTAVGKYSYGMYVYHLILFLPLRHSAALLRKALPSSPILPGLVTLGIWLALVFLFSKMSYDLLEKPILSLKSRFAA